MPRRRSMASMERDAQAADLYRRGLSYRQIANQLGWKNQRSAFDAVRRAAVDAARDGLANAEALTLMLERLQDYRRIAWRVASTRHYATTATGVATIRDEHGNETPLLDDGPVLAAVDRLMKCDDLEARLRGLYAPARARIEVVDDDVARALVDQLEAELAQLTAEANPRNSLT